jgi:formylglycine-generating enzyme required for sulfatase activity
MIAKLLLLILSASVSLAVETVTVPKGASPLIFRDKGEENIMVPELRVDATPVTNEEYLQFVKAQPQWSRSKIKPLFADSTYLNHWSSDFEFSPTLAKKPVTQVSWFAARAYCKSQGKRLPITVEWEYFSDASTPESETALLRWYEKSQESLRPVRQGKPNKFGLYDSIGLVWEWVDDFNSAIMSGDSREGPMRDMFCAGASLNAKNPSQYAAFIRYAFRSSLNAQFTTATLGFRCVQSINSEKK